MSAIYCGVTAVIEVNDLMSMDASYDCLVDIIKSDPGAFTECGPILDFIYEDAKRCRENRNRSTCLWDSSWGRLLLNPEIRDSTSWYARLFRRRFRLPYDLFVTFVEECREVNLFKEKNYSKIPIEFKILMSLRILGRDSCADDISEYINIGDSTVNHIFKLFLLGCVELLYNKYVYIPFGEELDKVKLVYEKLGLPGCIGSMDCTHILWHRCPKISRNICTGKEAKPTVAFQVIVDHSRKIMHVSKWFYGTWNDKQITGNDTFPMKLWGGKAFPGNMFFEM